MIYILKLLFILFQYHLQVKFSHLRSNAIPVSLSFESNTSGFSYLNINTIVGTRTSSRRDASPWESHLKISCPSATVVHSETALINCIRIHIVQRLGNGIVDSFYFGGSITFTSTCGNIVLPSYAIDVSRNGFAGVVIRL